MGQNNPACEAEGVFAIQERAVSENPMSGPNGKGWQENLAYTLEARNHGQSVAIFDDPRYFDARGIHQGGDHGPLHPPLNGVPGQQLACGPELGVRRLTPREWERLQGFSDDYTLVPYRGKPAKDGPRYKAVGNAFPVPVIAWIGRRIEAVAAIGRSEG